jgi:enolase
MSKIKSIKAIQVLDSRGVPTVACRVVLENLLTAGVMVPSGASTGAKEAIELRDGKEAYMGKGVLKAVKNINEIIGPILIGQDPSNQEKIDKQLIELDGTEDKSNLGANAILAVSLAICRVAAKDIDKSLHNYFGDIYKDITGKSVEPNLPMPMLNILNGGEHADNNIDIQEFMVMPVGAKDFKEAMRWASEIYWNLKVILKDRGLSSSVGDEGGFAPNLKSNEEAIQLILESIEQSNLIPGKDVCLSLDCAASEFYKDDKYHLAGEGRTLDSQKFA